MFISKKEFNDLKFRISLAELTIESMQMLIDVQNLTIENINKTIKSMLETDNKCNCTITKKSTTKTASKKENK